MRLCPIWALLGATSAYKYVTPGVDLVSTDLSGWQTYHLSVGLRGGAQTVFTVFGSEHAPLFLPPAYQVKPPFGTNVGGLSPAFYVAKKEAQFDSWLTVGITKGDVFTDLSSAGISPHEWSSWSPSKPLNSVDGAIFWMDPYHTTAKLSDDQGHKLPDPVVAQLTVKQGFKGRASMGISGHLQFSKEQLQRAPADRGRAETWRENYVLFYIGMPAPPPSPEPSPEPSPAQAPPPPSSSQAYKYIVPTVQTVSSSGVPGGYTTYHLGARLKGGAANVYTLIGSEAGPLNLPPAFQVAAPFGANYGGVNPAFYAVKKESQYDSWVTVGLTTGQTSALGSAGLSQADWAGWCADFCFSLACLLAPGGVLYHFIHTCIVVTTDDETTFYMYACS